MIRKRPNGTYEVWVYNPALKRKVYIETRASLRGEGGAQELERDKKAEFANRKPDQPQALTIRVYADEWLTLHHGPKTRRPQETTARHNAYKLKPFLETFGDRPLDGGVSRREALKWTRQFSHNAKAVSAMFNDAIDDEVCKANPFANRRQEESRERKHIKPITEAELDTLARIALEHWGETGYGLVARAWVLFAAWVGCRPGETFSVTARDLDFAASEVTIRRVKRRGGKYPIDRVAFPRAAQEAVRAMPSIPAVGPVFRTLTGRPITKDTLPDYWVPIRSAFRATVSAERWAELLDDQPTFQLYSLRHMTASLIVERGGNEYDVAAQLGNSPEVCREVYIHSYSDRANARNLERLNRPGPAPVVDLNAGRARRIGGGK